MSERTRSTRSKTRTDTLSSGDTEPPVEDRWSNHINYHQLVSSSCISILQLWWHPYVHDLRSFLPFLFLYNLFSVVISYPMFYLELAIGVVTKKSVMNCWDLEPVARGASVTMLIVCMYTILCLGLVSSYCLALLVHSFHSFLPWLHCAADARHACVARHRPMSDDSDIPSQSFFFNLVLNLKREGLGGGLGSIVWELSIYYVICWVLIYFIAIKGIYSYSKVGKHVLEIVLFKDVLAFFSLISLAIGVTRLEGSGRMFEEADWTVLLDGPGIWREAIEYALLQMSIGQGTTMMLGSYCPIPKHNLRTTAMLTFMVSKTTTMASALVLGGVHGALKHDYENLNVTNIVGGSSASLVLWSDTVARVPGSQFWSAVVFFTLFALALATVALMVQTIMSALTGKSVRKVKCGFLILLCFLFCLIGILTLCAQGGLFILNFLMAWPVTRLRLPLAAMTGIVITFLHGQKTFCEDVFFAVGEYPCLFYRLSWAVCPWFLIIMFLTSFFGSGSWRAIIGWLLVHTSLLPVAIIAIVYFVFKCRVRNIVGETK